MARSSPTYTEEFKKEVLAYWASSQERAKEVADHFGVSEYSLYHWRKKYGTPRKGEVQESTEEELRRLRRENRRLLMRCEILKKTVGIFSEAPENDTK